MWWANRWLTIRLDNLSTIAIAGCEVVVLTSYGMLEELHALLSPGCSPCRIHACSFFFPPSLSRPLSIEHLTLAAAVVRWLVRVHATGEMNANATESFQGYMEIEQESEGRGAPAHWPPHGDLSA
jgi:hypothetical protein